MGLSNVDAGHRFTPPSQDTEAQRWTRRLAWKIRSDLILFGVSASNRQLSWMSTRDEAMKRSLAIKTYVEYGLANELAAYQTPRTDQVLGYGFGRGKQKRFVSLPKEFSPLVMKLTELEAA